MSILNSSLFKKYLLPGFVFQSVIIAGGYGTGREIVEYFLSFGPIGGILGMALTTLLWSLVLAATFEFARCFRAYDYRTFFQKLLGRFWMGFEIIYILYLLIVLAVIGSAAGLMLKDNFHLPYMVGVMIMLISVGYFTFQGSRLIEKFLSVWSFLLYGVYGVFLIVALTKFGSEIQRALSGSPGGPQWALGSVKYAVYNLGNIAAVLFCLRHIQTRREAVVSGLIGGVIGIVPAFLFYIAVIGHYPGILDEAIPAVFVLKQSGVIVLLILFQITLFGTLVESGTAFIHSVNERIQAFLKTKGRIMPRWHRPVVALMMLLAALAISTFGLINLIAKGYGAASWAFLFIFVLPLVTSGIHRIIKQSRC